MNESHEKAKSWTNWFEIAVSNFERAKSFYEKIFDTEIEKEETAELTMGVFPHKEVGCSLCYNPEYYHPGRIGTLVYLNANPDLQVVQDKIEEAGGTLLVPKKKISDGYGYMCVFLDSEGNKLALHSDH
ncbi:MAG: VOC family protein [Brumimicrobium sp.]|nr:VOC family protein [Brumimicrobium sp.]